MMMLRRLSFLFIPFYFFVFTFSPTQVSAQDISFPSRDGDHDAEVGRVAAQYLQVFENEANERIKELYKDRFDVTLEPSNFMNGSDREAVKAVSLTLVDAVGQFSPGTKILEIAYVKIDSTKPKVAFKLTDGESTLAVKVSGQRQPESFYYKELTEFLAAN